MRKKGTSSPFRRHSTWTFPRKEGSSTSYSPQRLPKYAYRDKCPLRQTIAKSLFRTTNKKNRGFQTTTIIGAKKTCHDMSARTAENTPQARSVGWLYALSAKPRQLFCAPSTVLLAGYKTLYWLVGREDAQPLPVSSALVPAGSCIHTIETESPSYLGRVVTKNPYL